MPGDFWSPENAGVEGRPISAGTVWSRIESQVGLGRELLFARSNDGHTCPVGSDPVRSITSLPHQSGVGSVRVHPVRPHAVLGVLCAGSVGVG